MGGDFDFGGRSRQSSADLRANRFDPNSLSNPYGTGSRYKTDGLMNPYSQYGSRYSNDSWRNPYATNPPKLYSDGKYLGELSTNERQTRHLIRMDSTVVGTRQQHQ